MNSFVMCTKTQCIKASECFRLRASPDLPDQLYNDFINLCNEEDDYHFFMRIMDKDNVVELHTEEGEINGEV